MIKDRLVCGILDNALRERLLREENLDLEKALKLCRATEAVKVQAKELFSDSCKVDAVNKNTHRVNKRSAASEIK